MHGLLALLQAAALSSPGGPLTVRVAPDTVYVEQDERSRLVNFDFLLDNGRTEPRLLTAVRLSAYDTGNRLVWRRFCDQSGMSPCIHTLPGRELAAGGSGILYNPFYSLPVDREIAVLEYTLVFADSAGATADSVRVPVTLHPYLSRTRLILPLAGRVLVFDGHDYYAHHRRWNLAHPLMRQLGFHGNSGRYAYDLSIVDSAGRMFRGDGDRNEDWYSWDAVVRAPGAGTVVAAVDDQPDWEIGRTSLPDSMVMARPASLYGNYVILDHGNGEFSLLAHLRQGSVTLRAGDRVRRGAAIGRVGFSGSVYTIHNHYQLQRGPALDAEGLPSAFWDLGRVGARPGAGGAVRVDSGDLLEVR